MDLRSLIGDFSHEEFMHAHWERKYLHIPGVSRDQFTDILSLDDIDEYLGRADLRVPSMRMMLNGAPVPPENYTTAVTLGEYHSNDWIQSDKVLAYYRLGATIIIQLAHYSLPRLRAFSSELQNACGFNNEMNVYLTPPGKQGFATHYDTHSVMVLQISGSKRWSLYGKTHQLPLLSEKFNIRLHTPGPVEEEITLHPGDVLYVPRGRYHSASAQEGHSLHITIGLFPPSWLDLYRFMLSTQQVGNQALRSCAIETADPYTSMFTHEQRSSVMRAYHFATYDGQAQVTRGRLNDYLRLQQPITAMHFVRRRGVNVVRSARSDLLELRCGNAVVKMPLLAEPLLAFIQANSEPFTTMDLPAIVDDRGKEAFIVRLVEEGILTVA